MAFQIDFLLILEPIVPPTKDLQVPKLMTPPSPLGPAVIHLQTKSATTLLACFGILVLATFVPLKNDFASLHSQSFVNAWRIRCGGGSELGIEIMIGE